MVSGSLKKASYVLVLGLFMVSAFFIGSENFKSISFRSVDEAVYHSMIDQVFHEGLSGYNTNPYGEFLRAKGKTPPPYFFQPLFKHPPLFTLCGAVLAMFVGIEPATGMFVSLFFGTLLIAVTYLLAQILFDDRRVSVFAAFCAWMDPVLTACSQRIWMDTMISFFMVLSVYWFICAIKKNNARYFILSGIALGLGVNTKYTAILPLLGYMLYALFNDKTLFRNKFFWTGSLLPFFMLVPWAFWNWRVFGGEVIHEQAAQHSHLTDLINDRLLRPNSLLALLVFLFIAGSMLFVRSRNLSKRTNENFTPDLKPDKSFESALFYISVVIFGMFMALFMSPSLFRAIDPFQRPFVVWYSGAFSQEPPWFYLGRLIEYAPIYVFAYAGWLVFWPDGHRETAVVRMVILVVLLFFIFWGSFQSRYILSLVPLFLALAAQTVKRCFEGISRLNIPVLRGVLRGILMVFVGYGLYKTLLINHTLIYSSNYCYF